MRLGREAISDPLSGSPNRRHFDIAIKDLLSRALVNFPGEGFSLAILDIDHVKPVNGEHGHDVGD
ncbi:diguanylate cyclase [Halomonas sp. SH5A2]|uniref:GGDEF domain-containing protein n=1 Tax=Halomonas sp. SH5A2 TaxID=2749040 RepID=UPI001641A0DF|nr:diguanylate cyclase [Halomonas sp. SH5A2]